MFHVWAHKLKHNICRLVFFGIFFFFGKDSKIITYPSVGKLRFICFFFLLLSFFFFQHVTTSLNKKKTTHTEKKLKWEKCFPAAEASPSRSSGRLRQNTRPYSLTVSEAILPVVFFGCSLSFVLFSFFSVKGCVWLRYFIMFASSSSVAGTGREKEKKRKWWGCLVFFSPFTVGKRRIVPTGSQLSGMTAIISHLCFGCILYCKLQYICRQGI